MTTATPTTSTPATETATATGIDPAVTDRTSRVWFITGASAAWGAPSPRPHSRRAIGSSAPPAMSHHSPTWWPRTTAVWWPCRST